MALALTARAVCSSSRCSTLYISSIDSSPEVFLRPAFRCCARSLCRNRPPSAAVGSAKAAHHDEKAVLFPPASALDRTSGRGADQGTVASRATELLTDGWVRVQPGLDVLVADAAVRSVYARMWTSLTRPVWSDWLVQPSEDACLIGDGASAAGDRYLLECADESRTVLCLRHGKSE
jgi:hypothetical protein